MGFWDLILKSIAAKSKQSDTKRTVDPFDQWIASASLEELKEAYEKRRIEWLDNGQNGTGEKTPEMEKLNSAISKKVAELWEKDPRRSKDPNYRWTDANRWEKD